jgi:hypothetical protein
MTFFWNPKHKGKNKSECSWQHFGTQSSFWIKVKLNSIVRWRGLDKSNVYKIYNVHFSMLIGPHVYRSWHITKPKKNEKIIQCSLIKYFLFLKVIAFSQK